MNRFRIYGLLGLLVIVAAVSGCTDGGAVAFRYSESNDIPELLAETTAVQESTLNNMEADQSAITLAHTLSIPKPAKPSLITLPRGGDLLAKINRAAGPVLLDFHADWCGPCRTQGQILHDLEGTAAKTDTLIIKINVDEHPQLAEQLRVSSLPTLMMIKGGKIVQRQTGVADKSRLVAWMR